MNITYIQLVDASLPLVREVRRLAYQAAPDKLLIDCLDSLTALQVFNRIKASKVGSELIIFRSRGSKIVEVHSLAQWLKDHADLYPPIKSPPRR